VNASKTRQEVGFADYLTYQTLLTENVVQCKNGALLAGFWYDGPDLESATPEEIEYLIAHVNRSFVHFGRGWMLHVEMIRKKADTYPNRYFKEPTNLLIDVEREEQHKQEEAHFETKIALFFTYLPPFYEQSGIFRKIANFVMGEDEESYLNMTEKTLKDFESRLEEFETSLTASRQIHLSRIGVKPFTVQYDGVGTEKTELNYELLQALNYVVNGKWQPIRLPSYAPTYLDTLLARDMLVGYPVVYDDKKILVVGVIGYPHDSYPGILHDLSLLPHEVRFSNRFIFTDYMDASGMLSSLRKKWVQKTRSFISILFNMPNAPINIDAAMMVEDVDLASVALDSGDVCYGNHTCTVIVRGNDEEVEERARQIEKIFEFRGFSSKVEKRNGYEAFMGSLPGHGYENVRKPIISSLNYADIIPMTTDWAGNEFCPSHFFPEKSPALIQAASVGATPFRLNLHDGDVGHTLILGPTGAGKSTILSLIASQFERYENSKVFVFDKGYSMFPLASACMDASHYDIGDDEESGEMMRFCPLAAIDSPPERLFAQEWLETLVYLQTGNSCTPDERQHIHNALKNLAETTTKSKDRTMTHLVATIQNKTLRTTLDYYTGNKPGGILLDGEQNEIRYKSLTVFELEKVYNMSEKLVVPIFLFLFHEIERRLSETKEGEKNPPNIIVIDEAWTALNHTMFQKRLSEWLLVLRKKNCAVVLATQNLSHIIDSPIRQTILDSCFTRILLPNPSALNADMKKLYMEYLALNSKQVQIIAQGVMKRHYYYAAPNSRRYRKFDLALGPVALAFVGSAGKEDLKQIRALIAKHGDAWPAYWLTQKDLNDWAVLWGQFYDEYKAKEKAEEEEREKAKKERKDAEGALVVNLNK